MQKLTFRPSFWVLFVWMTGLGLIAGWFGASLLLLGLGVAAPKIPRALVPGSVTALVLGFLFAIAFRRILAQSLSAEGVHAHNIFGARRFILWQEISTIRPISVIGLKYLRLFTKPGERPVWLFLQPACKVELKRGILALAPVGNPIRAYFG